MEFVCVHCDTYVTFLKHSSLVQILLVSLPKIQFLIEYHSTFGTKMIKSIHSDQYSVNFYIANLVLLFSLKLCFFYFRFVSTPTFVCFAWIVSLFKSSICFFISWLFVIIVIISISSFSVSHPLSNRTVENMYVCRNLVITFSVNSFWLFK